MATIDQHQDGLTVACQLLIETVGDLRMRGHIKEHPEFIEHSADLVAVMLVEVREAVARERAAADFPPLAAGEAALDHRGQAAGFADHRCNCGYCRNGA